MWTVDTAEGIGTHKISDGKRVVHAMELNMCTFVKEVVLCSHQKQPLAIFIKLISNNNNKTMIKF